VKWQCKICGETSYSGDFCRNCDRNFWRYTWRRRWLQVWSTGVILSIVGIILQSLIGWIIWGVGIICFGLSFGISVSWGKKFVRKKFTQIQGEGDAQ